MTPNPPIPPALTSEIWNDLLEHGIRMTTIESAAEGMDLTRTLEEPERDEVARRHACAALCLYDQPFGFTHEDVEVLRFCANALDDDPRGPQLTALAVRISRLLPPK